MKISARYQQLLMLVRDYGETRPHARPYSVHLYVSYVRPQYEYGMYKVTQSAEARWSREYMLMTRLINTLGTALDLIGYVYTYVMLSARAMETRPT